MNMSTIVYYEVGPISIEEEANDEGQALSNVEALSVLKCIQIGYKMMRLSNTRKKRELRWFSDISYDANVDSLLRQQDHLYQPTKDLPAVGLPMAMAMVVVVTVLPLPTTTTNNKLKNKMSISPHRTMMHQAEALLATII